MMKWDAPPPPELSPYPSSCAAWHDAVFRPNAAQTPLAEDKNGAEQLMVGKWSGSNSFHLHPDDIDAIARRVVALMKEYDI